MNVFGDRLLVRVRASEELFVFFLLFGTHRNIECASGRTRATKRRRSEATRASKRSKNRSTHRPRTDQNVAQNDPDTTQNRSKIGPGALRVILGDSGAFGDTPGMLWNALWGLPGCPRSASGRPLDAPGTPWSDQEARPRAPEAPFSDVLGGASFARRSRSDFRLISACPGRARTSILLRMASVS